MKMMKKVLMILAVAALVLSMTGGVAGDTVINNLSVKDNATVTVTLNLDNDFQVVIPADFSFQKKIDADNSIEYTALAKVTASVTLLESDHWLCVNVSSTQYETNNWTVKTASSPAISLPYYMKNSTLQDGAGHISDADINDKEVKLLQNGENVLETKTDSTIYLHLKLAEIPVNTGIYTDQLKFTVYIDDRSLNT